MTEYSHGSGCGCKIAPAVLGEMLSGLPRAFADPKLLVGLETGDDAAVYRLNDSQAVVATTDFFMPIVDDPVDCAMVRAINDMGHVLGKKTIAEFVENERTVEMLQDIGIDFVQGLLFGKLEPLKYRQQGIAVP